MVGDYSTGWVGDIVVSRKVEGLYLFIYIPG
jgi:hypothetical protein